ncbi:MAG: hypothetical protein ACR2GK_12330 [Gemmatimonadaceae bacterium]
MSNKSSSQVFSLRHDVVVTALEREAVLLDLQTKYFYSVNPAGWAITQLFEGGASRDDVRSWSATWGARNGDLTAIDEFVDRLVAERLVVPGESPFPAGEVAFDGAWAAPSVEKHREPLQRVMVSAFDPTLPLAE